VELPNGTSLEYLVDGENRRVAKMVDGTITKRWLWSSQLRVAAELGASGALAKRFIYGEGANSPELMVTYSGGAVSKVYRIITDQLGSPVLVVNTANAADVLLRAQYDSWGNRTVIEGDADAVPFGFAGGLLDVDTGLVRFGARDYDPEIGRWVSKDAIRFAGGINLYVYAKNDPVNLRDTDGRLPSRKCVKSIVKGCEEGAHGICAPLAFAACVATALTDEALGSGGYCEPEPDCAGQWRSAYESCAELITSEQTPSRRRLRGGANYDVSECAKGFVSQECGGNMVDWGG
jgi:RHS repeat-associated protein